MQQLQYPVYDRGLILLTILWSCVSEDIWWHHSHSCWRTRRKHVLQPHGPLLCIKRPQMPPAKSWHFEVQYKGTHISSWNMQANHSYDYYAMMATLLPIPDLAHLQLALCNIHHKCVFICYYGF